MPLLNAVTRQALEMSPSTSPNCRLAFWKPLLTK